MLTCTACREEFDTYELQKEHFKLDWHRYNLKRKVVGLPPVSLIQFHARKADGASALTVSSIPKEIINQTFKCHNCNKSFTNPKAVENHKATKKHQMAVKKADNIENITSKIIEINEKQDDTAEEDENDMEDADISLELEHCMFCSYEADSLESNLTHMQKQHGFFIPDIEYLQDLEGLIKYLIEKVKLGHYCLYCNGKGKVFRSYRDCQNHMIDLSHCKLLYEEYDDLHEYEEFYDFTASYGIVPITTKQEDGEWEDVEEIEDDGEDQDELADIKTITISDTGAMVLPDGRELGQREFRRYYKQRHRPDEVRESVLAQTKERLLLAYQMAGIEMSNALSISYAKNFLSRRTRNIAEFKSIQEARSVRHKFQKHRERLETRSHKLQKNPNRKVMITV